MDDVSHLQKHRLELRDAGHHDVVVKCGGCGAVLSLWSLDEGQRFRWALDAWYSSSPVPLSPECGAIGGRHVFVVRDGNYSMRCRRCDRPNSVQWRKLYRRLWTVREAGGHQIKL